MNGACTDKEGPKDELKGRKSDVGSYKECRCSTGSEDGIPKIFEERRHCNNSFVSVGVTILSLTVDAARRESKNNDTSKVWKYAEEVRTTRL